MTRVFNALLVFVLLQVSAHALYHKDVTTKTFDKLLNPAKSHLLIEFYAPWCGHCKNLAPEYERLGETFAGAEDVVIAQVDADKHKKLASRFDVKGFPTLKWVQKGSSFDKAEEPQAERTAEGLLKYVNEKTGMAKKLKGDKPSAVTQVTSASFKEITASGEKVAFIGFFAPWCGHCKALKPAWEKLAEVYAEDDHVVIGAIDCDAETDLCQSQEVQGYPTLKVFTAGESEKYEQGRDMDSFIGFINSKAGLDYTAEGGVTESAGVIKEIEEHVGNFVAATNEDERTNVMNTCTETVDALEPAAINRFMYYRKVFGKIAEKGIEYVKKEKDRLTKVLETSQNLKNSQRRSFMRRINVLNVFDKQD